MPADNRSRSVQVYPCEWRGIALSITHVQRWCAGIDHVQVQSAGRVPLPIAKTGFKSLFTPPERLNGYADAKAYVLAWLEHEAASGAWTQHEEEAQQLSLF